MKKIAFISFCFLSVGCLIFFKLKNINSPHISQDTQKQQSESSITSPPKNASSTPKLENNSYVAEITINVYKKPSTTSEVVTQALQGEPVTIIAQKDRWLEVMLKDQFNYQGWIERKAVRNIALEINNQNKKIIAVAQGKLRIKPDENADILTALPMGSVVVSNETIDRNDFTSIQLIDGRQGYILSTELLKYESRKLSEVSSDQILATADKLINQPYLWGGMTQGGLDCSGFIHTVFKVNGIILHRDADLQYFYDGVDVNKDIKTIDLDLLPGDLVFFQTYKSGASHVGIYVGNHKFIQSSPRKGVNHGNLDDEYFSKRYLGAKRVLKNKIISSLEATRSH